MADAAASTATMRGEEFLRRAAELVPTVRERAPEAEKLRRLPDATVEDLHRLDLWRGMQPARWGGHEIDPATYYDACIELGTACASTSWVLAVVGVHSWQLALFDLQAQEDVWGKDSSVLIASSYAPIGKVSHVEGGFRISGQWSFSSGCDYADWILTGAIVDDPERPGRQQGWTLLIPKSDYKIVDNWQVAGLSGSGSKAFVIEDAFVPSHRALLTRAARKLDTPGTQHNTNPIYRMPFMNVFVYAVSSPMVGVARGLLDLYLEQGRKRASAPNSPLARDSFAHARIARAAAQIASARRQVQVDLGGLLDLAKAGDPIDNEVRHRARWGAAYALDLALDAVDRVFEVGGGFSIHLDNPMQRMFRDAHAMRVHASNNVDRAAEGYGRALLGLPDEGGVL